MHHCKTPAFYADNYCADCGEAVDTSGMTQSVLDYQPDLLDEVKEHLDSVSLYTGMVESSYLHKRENRTFGKHSEDVTNAYQLLTLRNHQGEEKVINVNAENTVSNKLKPGDVVTIYSPGEQSLNHQVSSGSASSNDFACSVVVHGETENQASSDFKDYAPTEMDNRMLGFYCAVLTIVIWFASTSIMHVSVVFGLIIATSASCLISHGIIQRKKARYKRMLARLEAVKAVVPRLLEISRYDLGYQHFKRPSAKDDRFCPHCQQANAEEAAHCVHCGKALMSGGHGALTDGESGVGEAVTASLSRQELAQAQMKESGYASQAPYVHRHLLGPNKRGEIHTCSFLVRVVDKDLKTEVNDNTKHTYTTITDNRHGYRQWTEHRSHRSRSVALKGQLWVEDEYGEVTGLPVNEHTLAFSEVGDWLLVGKVKFKVSDEAYHFDQFFYNISKDKYSAPDKIEDFNPRSLMAAPVMIGVAVIAYFLHDDRRAIHRSLSGMENVLGTAYLDYYQLLLDFGISHHFIWPIIFALFCVVVRASSWVLRRINNSGRSKALKQMYQHLTATLKRKEVLQKL